MAPLKKILFIGRTGPDTGYNICRQLANHLNFKLTVASSVRNPKRLYVNTDYVFVSGYLTIVEAALNRKLIFASYVDPVRKDILFMHPISRYMIIGQSPSELVESFHALSPVQMTKMIDLAYLWAKDQTWDRLASQYEKLWQI